MILLAGSPATAIDNAELTVESFLPCFERFLADVEPVAQPNNASVNVHPSQRSHRDVDATTTLSNVSAPAWRRLPIHFERLHTGWTQPLGAGVVSPSDSHWHHRHQHHVEESFGAQEGLSFFTVASSDADAADAADDANANASNAASQFLEESLALHDGSAEDGFSQDLSSDGFSISNSNSTSFASAASPSQSFHAPLLPPTLQVQDLDRLPSATDLAAQRAPAPRVNLLVCILSLPSTPQTVLVRRTGEPIDLVELLVSDDTRSGFSASFWLERDNVTGDAVGDATLQQGGDGDGGGGGLLRRQLAPLRRGDVVLLRNVALAHFRDRVHAQSVRSRLKQGRRIEGTTVLRVVEDGERRVGDAVWESALGEGAMAKCQRVKAWRRRFFVPGSGDGRVGAAESHGVKRAWKRDVLGELKLPVHDTQ